MIEIREKFEAEPEDDEWLESKPVKTHPMFAIFVIGLIFFLFLIFKRANF